MRVLFVSRHLYTYKLQYLLFYCVSEILSLYWNNTKQCVLQSTTADSSFLKIELKYSYLFNSYDTYLDRGNSKRS